MEEAGDRVTVMEVGREVGAVAQAAAILRAVAGSRDALGVTAIARAAGVSPSTTLNILRTLVHEGFVALVPETKTYRLGLGLLEVARPLLNRSDVELLQPGLQQVATEFEATTTVWQVAPDDKALVLGRIVPASGMHIEFRLATRIPAYAGAIGRAVAAAGQSAGQLPRATLRARFGAIRWHVPVPFDTFLEEVATTAARGYAVDRGHLLRGVTSAAAALCDRTGRPRLVVAAHLFQGQLTEERLQALGLALCGLVDTARPAMFGVAEGPGPRRRGGSVRGTPAAETLAPVRGCLPGDPHGAGALDGSDTDTMSEQRDVTTRDGTAWTCIEALADMPEAAKDKLAGAGRRAVVCTPSGGAHSVRLSLAENWQAMPDSDLAAAIQAGLARDDG